MPSRGQSTKWSGSEALQAAAGNQVDELKRLIEAGDAAVEDACNDERQTLLHVAALNGAGESLNWLLGRPKLRKAVDRKDGAYRTPLHLGAAMGYHGCVQKLVDASASLDLQDETKSTPLILAVRFDWTEAARILLEAGADPLIEDQQGCNAVDVAAPGSELAEMMLAFRGMRRASGWMQLGRCLIPQMWKQNGARHSAYIAGEATPTPVAGHVVQAVQPTAIGRQATPADAEQRLPIKQTVQAIPAAASRAHADFAVFRCHAFFDDDVKRLEFEVAWKDQGPEVGTIKPGGAAAKRGMVPGDKLVEIGSVCTKGKGRDELLPQLKERPLLLKVDREERMRDPDQQHIELELHLESGRVSGTGLELQQLGHLVVISSVDKASDAHAAGFLEGDAIIRANGVDATGSTPEILLSAFEERPASVTIWRRPISSQKEPWSLSKTSKVTSKVTSSRML
mmetsp:Transcript_44576/g.80128  ORF Transcript_44576/g.80128 Transcript_44576/m.80128 type:complete len:454 (-) Transcript_44576:36-1397(-)|eukprot:CAMPEP_0197627780 /NCGR_PEP_ID=MMETSP1338-20131121/6296_1 /TAXON_ID=43686 ORGANISM="Pelagodinium beii, Strain RCC1491" /NCGR_SAMPLE_ID=MMETSP1338 /ASSEMBLY_ACC=CAM_ASM_000754 /LENGTH=453 /DNA_ID=CAMNT_0043198595 /DNA_START=54 /DNA_END=1415 /DNA_ORIENTATION=+